MKPPHISQTNPFTCRYQQNHLKYQKPKPDQLLKRKPNTRKPKTDSRCKIRTTPNTKSQNCTRYVKSRSYSRRKCILVSVETNISPTPYLLYEYIILIAWVGVWFVGDVGWVRLVVG